MNAIQRTGNELITAGTACATAAALPAGLYQQFIAYIDRGPKTTVTYLTNLKQFAAWLAFEGIKAPQRADVIAYRDYLMTDHAAIKLDTDSAEGWSYQTDKAGNIIHLTCKPNTAGQYIRTVKQLFKWAAAAGIYPDIAQNVHMPRVDKAEHRKDALQPEDVLTIEKSINAHSEARESTARNARKDAAGREQRATEQDLRLSAMYQLCVNAGLRTIELSRANIRDLECCGGQAFLYVYGKGHSEADQKKAIAAPVYDAIRKYLASRHDKPAASSPLFVSTGNRSGGKRIAARTISQMLKKAMKDAGYDSERITAHSLRHTAGTAVMNMTGNLYETQKYMRHADPATTEIYLHCNDSKKDADIAARLYAMYHGQKEAHCRERLASLVSGLNGEQIRQLEGIAAAMYQR